MKLRLDFSLPLLVIAFLLVCSASNAQPHKQPSITGGSEAEPSAWQWQVSVSSVAGECGGALIASNWVLTAGHCVFYFAGQSLVQIGPQYVSIVVGTNDLALQRGMHLGASQVIVSPGFQPLYCHIANGTIKATGENCANDIALIRLSRPAPPRSTSYYKKFAYPIGLVTQATLSSVASPGTEMEVTGFGLLGDDPTAPAPTSLYQASLKIAPCLATNRQDAICYTHAGAEPDVCPGDSGGPAVVHRARNDASSSYLLVGIVSTGPCTKPGQTSFTSVAAHQAWIEATIATLFFVEELNNPYRLVLCESPLPDTSKGSCPVTLLTTTETESVSAFSGNLLTLDYVSGNLTFAAPAIISGPAKVVSPSKLLTLDQTGQLIGSFTSPIPGDFLSPASTYTSGALQRYAWKIVFGPLVDRLYRISGNELVETAADISTTAAQTITPEGFQSAYDPVGDRIVYISPGVMETGNDPRPAALYAFDLVDGKIQLLAKAPQGIEFQGVAVDAAGNIYYGEETPNPYRVAVSMLAESSNRIESLGPLIVTTSDQAIDPLAIHWSFDNISNRLLFSSPILENGKPSIRAFDPIVRQETTLLESTDSTELDFPLAATK